MLSTAAVFTVAHVSMAQAPPAAPMQSQPTAPVLGINDPHNPLHFTADQQKKLTALKIQYQQEATQILENKTLTPTQKQSQITDLQKGAFAKFNAEFTPAQIKMQHELAEIVQSSNAKFNALKDQLTKSLTADQKNQLMKIRTDGEAKAQAINAGAGTQEQKEQQLIQLQQQFSQQMNGMFNPSQRDLINEMKAIKESVPAQEKKALAGF